MCMPKFQFQPFNYGVQWQVYDIPDVKSSISINITVAYLAWWFWLGAQSNKGGLGQRNLEEIGVASTLFHARSAGRFRVFLALPLVRLARQNRHATQATVILILILDLTHGISYVLHEDPHKTFLHTT